MKKIEKIEEEESFNDDFDSDAASDSQASCDNFGSQELDPFFAQELGSHII